MFRDSRFYQQQQQRQRQADEESVLSSGGGSDSGDGSSIGAGSARSGLMFAGVKLQHDKSEPIRNWNAHRVAMAWGNEQEEAERHSKEVALARRKKEAGIVAETKEERDRERKLLSESQQRDHAGGKIDVWLHAKDLYEKGRAAAEATLARKIDPLLNPGLRREEKNAAHSEYRATISKIGLAAPLIPDVVDPHIVDKWRSRFQTARIRAGVKDAAIKDSRVVHRSVVATARLGGAAICDGATKRAERWLRSHRDFETDTNSSNMISDSSSTWTVLCHRIAIAAVRVKAKRELADELHGFLSRLPKGRPTQDESFRMVERFERIVYGDVDEEGDDDDDDDDKNNNNNSSGEGEDKKKDTMSLSMRSFHHHGGGSSESMSMAGDSSPHVKFLSTPMASAFAGGTGPLGRQRGGGGGKTTLDRCLAEWMRGGAADTKKKKKNSFSAAAAAAAAGGSALENNSTSNVSVPRPPSALSNSERPTSAMRRPLSTLSNHSLGSGGGSGESSILSASSPRASSDLDRLLSAPVTQRDVEILIARACRESYAALFDDEDIRRAQPSTITRWAIDDPRRSTPRTQEGECLAAFLRWLVSPGAVEGMLGRVVSKNTVEEMFQF